MGMQKQPVVWARSWSAGVCCAVEAVSLPGSSLLVLKRSEAQQGEPIGMAFAGHQFPRALTDALGEPAAHEAPMVEEEPQQIQIGAAQMATQGEVGAQPRVEVLHQRAAAWGPRHGLAHRVEDGVELAARLRPQPVPPCQYAVEVVGRRCSMQASRTRDSEISRVRAMPASLWSSTPAKA